MNLTQITVTDVQSLQIVHSQKGRHVQMKKRQTYGLSLCIRGQITYTMNGKNFVSGENHAVLLPKGATYQLYGDEDGLFPLINFYCSGLDLQEHLVIPLEDPKGCLREFEAIKQLWNQGKDRLQVMAAFYRLLAAVSKPPEKKIYPLTAVISYMEKNLKEPKLSNAQLAQMLGISEVYLRKLFRTLYDTTPRQYLLELRIRKAKQLLVETPLSVSAAAEECGFSSVYHFCRAFRQRTGQTPTDYALRNKAFSL